MIPDERSALALTRDEFAQLETELRFRSKVESIRHDDKAEARNRLLGQFLLSAAVSAVLAELSDARAKHGLQIGEIASRPVASDPKRPWAQHEFAVPVRGSFADTRRLLAELLASHPTLALDSIEVRRTDSGEPGVETQLRFSLFYRR